MIPTEIAEIKIDFPENLRYNKNTENWTNGRASKNLTPNR